VPASGTERGGHGRTAASDGWSRFVGRVSDDAARGLLPIGGAALDPPHGCATALDLSPGQHVANRFGVPLPVARRGDIQASRDLM
jgi:hypothetical protein